MNAPARADAAETLLDVRDLNVFFGESHILQGVSFGVRRGGITGLLGRNGVGKTTTLRGILGLVPRTGSVAFDGDETTRLATHEIVRRGVAYVPEDRDVFAGLDRRREPAPRGARGRAAALRPRVRAVP